MTEPIFIIARPKKNVNKKTKHLTESKQHCTASQRDVINVLQKLIGASRNKIRNDPFLFLFSLQMKYDARPKATRVFHP